MASEAPKDLRLPIGPAIGVGTLTFVMSMLGLAPEGIVTLSGALPAVVKSDIPASLALLVCSVMVMGSVPSSLKGKAKGMSYLTAGTMLTVFVGAVLTLVGTSFLATRVLSGEHLSIGLVLRSGMLAGALLTLLAIGASRRTLFHIEGQMQGGGK